MKQFSLPLLVVIVICATTSWAIRTPVVPVLSTAHDLTTLRPAIAEVDAELERSWAAGDLVPAAAADDLTVLRRLSLALHGTIPSLEEIRRFEADPRSDRLDQWTAAMLDDPRFADYFAERLARAFVSVDAGQFLIFRRDRFTEWLSESLRKKVSYDELVRRMISAEGVWTGKPEVNYITQAFANEEFDHNKLAARTARAFLGQRIDCAQCHDHPFAEWKQSQFEQLAASFGQVKLTPIGLNDVRGEEFTVVDPNATDERVVTPGVPFSPEWMGTGKRREQLARWVTNPANARFERATINRLWALLFGKPFAVDRPVDDLPNPQDPATVDEFRLIDILGRDFRTHGYDLRRAIQIITASKAFRIASIHAETDPDRIASLERRWAVFPLIRLRPEQVIGAMVQSNTVKTIDQNSHLFTRAVRYFRERDFIDEFGDPGDAELQDRPSTIPQALLSMNGEFAQEMSNPTPFNTPGRLRQIAATPEQLLDDAFLICFTRRPTPEEAQALLPPLRAEARPSEAAIQDTFWALLNSPEFCWNH